MSDQDRLAELLARQRVVQAELDAIDAEIAEIEERRFPRQRKGALRLIKGGAVAAAIAAGIDKVRKHPGLSGAAMVGGALSGLLILGQIPGGDGEEITSDPPRRAPGVSVPWTSPPEVQPETPGPSPGAAGDAPASPSPSATDPGVPGQSPAPEPTGGPEGPPEPTSEPTEDEPEPTPEPTVPAPPSPTRPPEPPDPSPSPTATSPPETPSPSPTPTPTVEPPVPAEPEYLACVEADLSSLELEVCLLELG